MENKFNVLMEVVSELISLKYDITSYTLIDIKNERSDREIILVSTNQFKLYFEKGIIKLETTYSNLKVDSDFIDNITTLNSLKDQFNEVFVTLIDK